MYIDGLGAPRAMPLPEDPPHPATPPPATTKPSASQAQTVRNDYNKVATAQSQVDTAQDEMIHTVGMLPHADAESYLEDQQKALAAAQAQLDNDIEGLLLPDPSQGYTSNAVSAQAGELRTVFEDPTLRSYIDSASRDLQHSLNGLFGQPGDSNSLRTQIQDGDWQGAEHTEALEISAAGKGISNPAQRQTAMANLAQELVGYGPRNSRYAAGVNQAFDQVAVEPLVAQLDKLYANPASQPHLAGQYSPTVTSRAGAFAAAFKRDMQSSTPQVRVALMQDLLAAKNSPLLAVAGEIRGASNGSLGNGSYTLPYWRSRAAGIPPGYARGPLPAPKGTDLWAINSSSELDQAYRDLAAGTDLVAVGDPVGSGTGMTHQLAQAILGDPNKPGHANLGVLDASVRNAAADGNVNLSAEMAGILQSSGHGAQASGILRDASQGVKQFQARVQQDLESLTQLPQSLQIPVGSLGELFSDPGKATAAVSQYISDNPQVKQQVQAKLQADLSNLDVDGQAVVRINYAIQDMSPSLYNLPGAVTLRNTGDTLINGPAPMFAVGMSPTAQSELAYRETQSMIAASLGNSGAVQGGRGFQYFPPGALWVGRDLTGYYATFKAKGSVGPLYGPLSGPLSPINVSAMGRDLTGTVAQQINNLAQSLGPGAPLNIDAVQYRIQTLQNRSLTVQLGKWKGFTGYGQTVSNLQKSLSADANYETVQKLQGQLALSSDPARRAALQGQISAAQAQSVTEQLDWMRGQAGGDPALLKQIADLQTSYTAAQGKELSINQASAALQAPPTAANTRAWMNQAGTLADGDLSSGALTKTPQGVALNDEITRLRGSDPAALNELLSGKFTGSVDKLPTDFVNALQQYDAVNATLKTGPKGGLLPSGAGGLAFSAFRMAQMVGGAYYLMSLGDQPDGWLNVTFGATLGAFSGLPSVAEFGSGALQSMIGKDLSAVPGAGDLLTNLLRSGGWVDNATLFARGIGNGAWGKVLTSVSSWAWTPLMGIWAAQEFASGNYVQGGAVTAMGASYLLPELFEGSSWAGPAALIVDLVGSAIILGDSIYETNKSINQYDGAIQSLLEKAGLHGDVAAALAQPDSQGIAGVVRMGQIFNALPAYKSDQARIDWLNSLDSDQLQQLQQALTNMPLDKSGRATQNGGVSLLIAPPPASLSPAGVKQYYDDAFRAHGLAAPSLPNFTIPDADVRLYYAKYTAVVANYGAQPDPTLVMTMVNASRGQDMDGVMPQTVEGFLYYAQASGFPLSGALG